MILLTLHGIRATKSVVSEGSRNKELRTKSSVGTQVTSLAPPNFSISGLSNPLNTQSTKRRTKLAHDVEVLTVLYTETPP